MTVRNYNEVDTKELLWSADEVQVIFKLGQDLRKLNGFVLQSVVVCELKF